MKEGSCKPQDKKNQVPLPYVRRFPFITEVVRELIVCSQYRYLSILTDGGINPNPNIDGAGIPRNNLMLELDDGQIWLIDAETYNLNIERYGFLYFSNLNFDTHLSAHPQGGYGNLFLVFTMDKYRMVKQFKRNNPFYCVEVTIDNGAWSSYYWAGHNRPQAGYVLAIPYVPMGYQDLIVHVSPSSHTREYGLYHDCCDEVVVFTETNITHGGLPVKKVGYGIANRTRFRIQNTGLSPDTFNITLMYANKSDQGLG